MTFSIVMLSSLLHVMPVADHQAAVCAPLILADTGTVDIEHVEGTPVNIDELISYAQTFKGTPYKYASADPVKGFDCSGFVLYVFKHFHVKVPRSSSAFAKIGKKVKLDDAQPGDIILFTGPKSTKPGTVGHVGIVTSGGPNPSFIHATSGKAYSVIETSMSPHYRKRFVKLVRVI
jgi:cell wall-associated NlpC family hydrolase